MAYTYDKKYQLKEAIKITPNQYFTSFNYGMASDRVFGITYDANGNLLTMKRNNSAGQLAGTSSEFDNFTYNYANPLNNQLTSVTGYGKSYGYNAIGQLKKETSSWGSKYLKYDVTGKVMGVYADENFTDGKILYSYDEAGRKVKKVDNTGSTSITTYYVYDNSGNVMAIYDNKTTPLSLKEIPLYGSKRIGMYNSIDQSMVYELTDHLGSVRVVLKRELTNGQANVDTYSDFLPFGSTWNNGGTTAYRYNYQGQFAEQEKAGQWADWHAFDVRMYDARLGRWFSTDPQNQFSSPYIGMGNNPANLIDPDGGRVYFYNFDDGDKIVKDINRLYKSVHGAKEDVLRLKKTVINNKVVYEVQTNNHFNWNQDDMYVKALFDIINVDWDIYGGLMANNDINNKYGGDIGFTINSKRFVVARELGDFPNRHRISTGSAALHEMLFHLHEDFSKWQQGEDEKAAGGYAGSNMLYNKYAQKGTKIENPFAFNKVTGKYKTPDSHNAKNSLFIKAIGQQAARLNALRKATGNIKLPRYR